MKINPTNRPAPTDLARPGSAAPAAESGVSAPMRERETDAVELSQPSAAAGVNADAPVLGKNFEGKVTFWNMEAGFGFVAPDHGGPLVFVHYSAIQVPGFKYLEVGKKIRFDVDFIDGKGYGNASNVHKL